LRHLKQRGRFLAAEKNDDLIKHLICVDPSVSITDLSRVNIIFYILQMEYGQQIVSELCRPFLSKAEYSRNLRCERRTRDLAAFRKHVADINSSWPTKVTDDVIFKCFK